MISDEEIRVIKDYITENDDFLIISHVLPDGDTISSQIGMSFILDYFGKKYTMVNQDIIPAKFSYLPKFNEIKNIKDIDQKLYSSCIAVDASDLTRLGDISNFCNKNSLLLNIDHHSTNDRFGDINLVYLTSATAEIIYNLVNAFEIPINNDLATTIYTGILTDTGGFRYANTTEKVLSIAAEMVSKGANPYRIAEFSLETLQLKQIELLKEALQTLKISDNKKIAWITLNNTIFNNLGIQNEETDGLVAYARNIEGVEVGFLLKELKVNEVKVSLRSKNFIDVSKIAKKFSGGGHARAAGFTYHGLLSEIESILLSLLLEETRIIL